MKRSRPHIEVGEGTHYNPYFANAAALAMAKPISDDQVTYDDGSPQTVDQYAHDVSAFLMWAAEPHLEERKRTGFMVMVFLVIFTGADLPDEEVGLREGIAKAESAPSLCRKAAFGRAFFVVR